VASKQWRQVADQRSAVRASARRILFGSFR
jgi:hypothetical protein